MTKGGLAPFLRLPVISFDGTERDAHKNSLLHTLLLPDQFHFRSLNEDLDYLGTNSAIFYFGKNQHDHSL